MNAGRMAAWLWAGPNTLFGIVAALPLWLSGARARLSGRAIEVCGGRLAALLMAPGGAFPIGALTLGHVILAADSASLERWRAHEQVHVRQYEHWGAFFLPAYAASSLWQLLCGRRCYRDNWFERQAFGGG